MGAPPAAVLEAFGVDGAAEILDGGQGTSVRVGQLVLKPFSDPDLVAWFAGLCSRRTLPGLRMPAPVPARDGRLVVDGWSATRNAVGAPVADHDRDPASWLPVLRAGRLLHDAWRSEPCPPFLVRREDRWASADRAAWAAVDGSASPPAVPGRALGGARAGRLSAPLLARARALLVHEGLADQLVHGDLSGNVLLAPGLEPAVIDVSPYWRPAAYADAVVVVDALLWWRTDASLVLRAAPAGLSSSAWISLLARAVVFRLLAFDEPQRDHADTADELPRYADLLALLEHHAAAGRP